MSKSNSVINLGDLGKPATVLIERIADAIEGIAKPFQIVRVAKAEAEAEKIRAVSQLEITALERRAMARLFAEEAKKQNNIETITQKALPELSAEAKPEQIEDDWITNFFDKCRLISDEEMQSLWAKILAGEANSPGKFSKRTINLLASLDKSDALLFSKLCRFGPNLPLIYDTRHKIYTENGITFSSLAHLESTGLIHFNNLADYSRGGLPKTIYIDYFSQRIVIEFPMPEQNELRLGKVILTQAGHQLAPISKEAPIEGFVEFLKDRWKSFGYKVDPPEIEPSAPDKSVNDEIR